MLDLSMLAVRGVLSVFFFPSTHKKNVISPSEQRGSDLENLPNRFFNHGVCGISNVTPRTVVVSLQGPFPNAVS